MKGYMSPHERGLKRLSLAEEMLWKTGRIDQSKINEFDEESSIAVARWQYAEAQRKRIALDGLAKLIGALSGAVYALLGLFWFLRG